MSTPNTYHQQGVTVEPGKEQNAEHAFITSMEDCISGVRMKTAMCAEMNYFEVKITRTAGDGRIGIGLGSKNPLSSFPYWESGSIEYHADDGGLFYDEKRKLLGPTCKAGDRMGCGVDFTPSADDQVRVWFTKNDNWVYYRTMKLPANSKLYSRISMYKSGQEVQYLGHCKKLFPEGKRTAMVFHVGNILFTSSTSV